MSREAVYFAFGDSLTAGTGAPAGKGFVPIYHCYLEQCLEKRITLIKSGTEGATTGELLNKLRVDQSIRHSVEHAKLITITAGGNDLIQAAIPFFMEGQFHHLTTALRHFVVHSRQIVSTIHEIKAKQPQDYLILFVGLYNPLVKIPIADKWIRRFNRYTMALKRSGVIYVNVYNGFLHRESELLSDDLVHPNAEGYKVIAQKVARAADPATLQKLLK